MKCPETMVIMYGSTTALYCWLYNIHLAASHLHPRCQRRGQTAENTTGTANKDRQMRVVAKILAVVQQDRRQAFKISSQESTRHL